MKDYLLETCAASALLDARHEKHANVKAAIQNLGSITKIHISSIGLAELSFGFDLYNAVRNKNHSMSSHIISEVRKFSVLDVTRHTAAEYAALKVILATTYLKNPLTKERRRWIEDWVHAATGKKLQADENDLLRCAQAREMNLILITTDKKLTDVFHKLDIKITKLDFMFIS